MPCIPRHCEATAEAIQTLQVFAGWLYKKTNPFFSSSPGLLRRYAPRNDERGRLLHCVRNDGSGAPAGVRLHLPPLVRGGGAKRRRGSYLCLICTDMGASEVSKSYARGGSPPTLPPPDVGTLPRKEPLIKYCKKEKEMV